MKSACPTQFPTCLLYNCLVSYGFTAHLYVFPDSSAEMLPTLWLKTSSFDMFDILPIHLNKKGNYNRP